MVIGQIMLYDYCISEAAAILNVDDFYLETHRIIYKAALDLNREGTPTEINLVGQRIWDRGLKEKIGGLATLHTYLDEVCTGQTLEHYAKIVKKKAALRKLVHVTGDISQDARSYVGDADEFLAESRKNFIETTIQETSTREVESATDDLAEIVKDALKGDPPSNLIPVGIKKIDERYGGLPKGLLTIIAGRPGMGKSALLLNLAINIGLAGKKILYFTLEDGKSFQKRRMLARLANINLECLMLNRLNGEESTRLLNAQVDLDKLDQPLFWMNDDARSTQQIAQVSMVQKTTKGLDVLLVDHLGYVRDEGKDEYAIQSNAVRGFANMAKDLDVPIVLAVQLNRKAVEKKNERPKLENLRASGHIEEDARVVWILHREYQLTKKPEDINSLELHVEKATHGRVGFIPLWCDMSRIWIRDIHEEQLDEPQGPHQDLGY
jgi:replicative DNA helicase